MAIIKQASGHQRRWSDWLPHVVCVTALLTLISAGATGFLSQRLGTLASAQKIQQVQTGESASQALSQAKIQWQKKEVGLEKELLSAKLKIKAEQSTGASIRKRLVKIQKDLAALQKTAGVQTVKTAAQKAPVVAPKAATAAAPAIVAPTVVPAASTTVTSAPAVDTPKAPSETVPPTPQPQTVKATPAVTQPSAQPAPTSADAAGVPVSPAPAAAPVPAAPKVSEVPEKTIVEPVELAPPVSTTDSSILKVPDADKNAPGTTE